MLQARGRKVDLRVSSISPGVVETEFLTVHGFGDDAAAKERCVNSCGIDLPLDLRIGFLMAACLLRWQWTMFKVQFAVAGTAACNLCSLPTSHRLLCGAFQRQTMSTPMTSCSGPLGRNLEH